MARQRFIWPDLWADPGFGELDPLSQVLYIGCFSNADDEGRLLGDPAYLRSIVFPRSTIRPAKLRRALNSVLDAMPKLRRYEVAGVDYLQFTNWREWQKPKYPSASRLPPPPHDSGNDSPNVSRKASGKDSSTGWVRSREEDQEPFLPSDVDPEAPPDPGKEGRRFEGEEIDRRFRQTVDELQAEAEAQSVVDDEAYDREKRSRRRAAANGQPERLDPTAALLADDIPIGDQP